MASDDQLFYNEIDSDDKVTWISSSYIQDRIYSFKCGTLFNNIISVGEEDNSTQTVNFEEELPINCDLGYIVCYFYSSLTLTI